MSTFTRNALIKSPLFSISLILLACSGDNSEQFAQTTPTAVVSEVTMRDIRDTEQFIGRVEPIDTVDLQARVTGFLVSREVLDGQMVEEGETLFTIESTPYQADLAQAQAAAAEADAAQQLTGIELERNRELLNRQVLSQADFDRASANHAAAEAKLEAARAQIDLAEIRLAYTTITAPFDGRVGRLARSVGDVVGPGTGTLVNITRISPIYVSFNVSEGDLVSVFEERRVTDNIFEEVQALSVTVELPNGNILPENGEVLFMDNRVNPSTGTIAIRARFENQAGILVPGAFVNVELGDPEPESRLVVPQASLQQDQLGYFVLVVNDDGLVDQRYVTVGQADGTDIVVLEGLESGENVIVEGLQRVRQGQPVEAVPYSRPFESGPVRN